MLLENIKTLLEILAIIFGLYILLFVYLSFHPNMELIASTQWLDKHQTVLLVHIEMKNISKVRCDKEKAFIQFLEYPSEFSQLSEWVPFEKQDIPEQEQPVSWQAPIEILNTTRFWYPNDSIKIQRCYKCRKGCMYKIGIQLKARISPLGSLSKFFRKGTWRKEESWTTTRIIYSLEDVYPVGKHESDTNRMNHDD